MSVISERVLAEFDNKEFRDAYVDARLRNRIAYQVRAIRDQKQWSQQELANRLPSGKQSTVSRFEDPEYGRLSITSLLDIASAYDVAVIVTFCSHEEFLQTTRNLTPETLRTPSYNKMRVQKAIKNAEHIDRRFIAYSSSALAVEPRLAPENLIVKTKMNSVAIGDHVTSFSINSPNLTLMSEACQ